MLGLAGGQYLILAHYNANFIMAASLNYTKINSQGIMPRNEMKKPPAAIKYTEGKELLFQNAFGAIPFNIFLSIVLSIYLYKHYVPHNIIYSWFGAMVLISIIRLVHCIVVLKEELLISSPDLQIKIFVLLTGIMGLTWSSIYFLALTHTELLSLYVIVLVFGGMSAGATASLSVYLPAFFAYVLSIFIPVIIHSYQGWTFDGIVLGTIFLLYLMGITLVSKSIQRLLRKLFYVTEQHAYLTKKFEELSITDTLTGLYNRRHLENIFKTELERSKRNQHSIAFIFLDIDNFKQLNDHLGHSSGDKFLVYVATYLKYYFKRANDIIFRLGGDEFSVLMINTTEEGAKAVCDDILTHFKKIPKFNVILADGEKDIIDRVGISIGLLYILPEANASIEKILQQADEALYEAKKTGKNQISFAMYH
jgi:diguanylate cyclase (GGDEF)-like protein